MRERRVRGTKEERERMEEDKRGRGVSGWRERSERVEGEE